MIDNKGNAMNINDVISSCPLDATSNRQIDLHDYHGQWIVLYFYPKDATPGCTTEGQNFRDKYDEFKVLDAIILGVSRDHVKSHESFKAREQFPFELLSDANEHLCEQFDVIKMKSMYGKQVRGIERSTFIIDPKGIVRHAWRKVKVAGHVDEVYNTLKTLQKSI